jgi:RNA polymerase sigma factor (sigma-70 family)
MDPIQLYDSELIDKMAALFCRRYHFTDDDCADFRQDVHLKIIKDNYARLRQFKGKSSLKTYLHVMIQRMTLDYLIQKKGKWHPSATAKRLGPAAVALETSMYRDNRKRDEAIQLMLSKEGHGLSEKQLLRIAHQLRPRRFGHRESDDGADRVPDPAGANGPLLDAERSKGRALAQRKLRLALETLAPEDRLIIQMRYWDGFTIVRIANILKTEKRLYDRIARILGRLRSALNEQGLEVDDVRDLLPE